MGIKKHVPNTITSIGLACGVIGIIATLAYGKPLAGLYFMLGALACDYCDGLAARLLGAYSDMGKELDSIADMVNFGVLPSVMLYQTYDLLNNDAAGEWLIWLTLVLAVFSGLRLAKFNVDERQHESFIGLATPSSALLAASFCVWALEGGQGFITGLASTVWFIPALAVTLGALMVSGIPMFSFKFGKDIHADAVTKMKRYAFLSISAIVVILVVTLGWHWTAVIAGVICAYILMNICFAILRK